MINKKALILDIIVLLGLSFILSYFDIRVCPFFSLLHIPCPGCGLTRSIISFVKLDIINSLKYNILGIPFVIFSFIYTLAFLFKKDTLIDEFLEKNKKIIIILCIILFVIVEILNINNPLLY